MFEYFEKNSVINKILPEVPCDFMQGVTYLFKFRWLNIPVVLTVYAGQLRHS